MEDIKYENSMATILFNKNNKIVEVHWKKVPVEEGKFQDVLNNGLQQLIENSTNKWLANTTLLGVIPLKATKYFKDRQIL